MTPPTHRRFDPVALLPAGTVLLEASAGTGKTYTITSLVLRAVAESRVPLERILVVTFTRAAAAELRGRTRARLGAAIDAFDRVATAASDGAAPDAVRAAEGDEVIAHLIADALAAGPDEPARRRRALAAARERFDDATIDTIHGFCHRALQLATPDVDLDLDVELETDLTDLVDEVAHDLLVRELRTADPGWYQLLHAQGVGLDRLRAIARELEAAPDLTVLPTLPDTDPRELFDRRLADLRVAWQQQGPDLVSWLVERAADRGFHGRVYNASRPHREAAAIDAWLAGTGGEVADLDAIAAPLRYIGRTRIEEKLRAGGSIPAELDVVDAAEQLLRAPNDAAAAALSRLAHQLRTELAHRKRQRAIVSFTDLLVRLDDALRDDPEVRGAVRAGIRSRFDMALVDEFQDTDPVQWRILAAVFGSGEHPVGERPMPRLALIGDPKQAIYGFRGADVHTYLAAAADVPEPARFTLRTNWRSDQRYLDALEALFGRPQDFATDGGVFAMPGIDHVRVSAPAERRDVRLRSDRGHEPALEVRYVPRSLAADDGEVPSVIPRGWAWEVVPRLVAGEIVELLEAPVWIDGGTAGERQASPGDVAVLVRTNHQAHRVQAALVDLGVPAVVGSDRNVLGTPEALALQRLLDALLRSGDDRALRRALAGPILGVSAAELADPDLTSTDHWLDRFDRWSALWRERGVAVLLRTVFTEAGTVPRLLAQQRGERSTTNLGHLAELLHLAEVQRHLGPEGLAAWLREERHAGRASGDELELRLESDEDAVSVVTIHRSKGLQYPIVWCPFLWDGKLLRGGTDVLRYPDPATGARHLDLHPDASLPPKDAHIGLAAREAWREDLRLLYVALTRAQHRCVVHTGVFRDSGGSALHRLLHGAASSIDDQGRWSAPVDLAEHDDEELLAELRALAERAPDALGVAEVTALGGGRRWRRGSMPLPPLHTRRFDRDLDRIWQRTSFSRLIRDEAIVDEGPAAAGIDHDQVESLALRSPPVGAAVDGPIGHGLPEVPLAGFPRGAAAGTFLHGLLEELDLPGAAADPQLIATSATDRLRRSGLGEVDLPALVRGVQLAITTPLGPLLGDRPLAAFAAGDLLAELNFDLPVAGGERADGQPLTLGRLAAVFDAADATSTAPLAQLAQRLRARPDRPARGFLTGSIDLVVRDGGRYAVIDHKSNWLGDRHLGPTGGSGGRSTVAHYVPDRLEPEMVAHDYLLQAHLYLVALHRFLRWRLGDAYDYDTHVAGALYLFLRGMVGPDTPRDPEGQPAGVYALRPPRALIESLDAVLRGVAP